MDVTEPIKTADWVDTGNSIVYDITNMSQLDELGKVPKPISVIEKETGTSPVAIWGDDNDFPRNVINDVRKDPEIGTLLDKQAKLLYSGGIMWGKPVINDRGQETLEPLEASLDLKIRTWMQKSNIKRYLFEASKDMYWFYNVFPELTLTLDRTEIAQLSVWPAEQCRWSRQNPSNGVVEKCYISKQWPVAKPEDKTQVTTLPVLDPYYGVAEQIQKGNALRYIYPSSYPTPGNNYYQLADWNAIRTSGWLSFSQKIPKYKDNNLERTLGVKYAIEFNTDYFKFKYQNWDTLKAPEKQRIVDTETKKMQDWCTGVNSAGRTIVVNFKHQDGKKVPMIEFTPIKSAIEKGEYIEDGRQASEMKHAAVGLHPALSGITPNSGMGGAGSNIREAYNLHIIMNQFNQDLILEPLYVVRDYNGWGADVEFKFRNSLMTTLDAGKETKPKA
jgi:hypothetical protein